VSGIALGGILHGELHGSDLLTGGAFGAESSPVAVLVCFSAGLALLWLARRRGQIKPAPWRHRAVAPSPPPALAG
jgi:uncharacterized protein